jgi:hypothetical protein
VTCLKKTVYHKCRPNNYYFLFIYLFIYSLCETGSSDLQDVATEYPLKGTFSRKSVRGVLQLNRTAKVIKKIYVLSHIEAVRSLSILYAIYEPVYNMA